MLDNDIFVRHRLCKVDSMKDIAACINSAFNSSVRDAKGAILVLAAYCIYITYEEIYGTFPLSSSMVQTYAIPSLIKEGHLIKCSFSGIRGVSRSCFRITPSGFKRANELCGGTIPNKYKEHKSGGKNKPHAYDSFADHIYFSGYNLFSVLSLALPFEWRREFPYTYGRGYMGSRKKGDLIVDARCSFYPEDSGKYRILYVEEDTGAEGVDILLGKLDKYQQYHLMDDMRDVVTFSFYDKNASAPGNSPGMEESAYSTTKCKDIFYYMKEHGVDDALDLVGNRDIDQHYLKALTEKTGAIRVLDNGKVTRGSEKLTLEKVSLFYDSLKYRRNPYQHKEFNLRHASLSYKRLFRMADILLSGLSRLPVYARYMMRGFPVYCMATTLISDRIPYGMLSEFIDYQEDIKRTLSSYFGDVVYEGELSAPLSVSQSGENIRLRNTFSYSFGDGRRGLVAVEFLSFDLGAWIRAFLFLNYLKDNSQDIPVQLICVYDLPTHYTKFYKLINTLQEQLCIITDRSGIYGLMTYDIGKPLKIFTVTDSACEERLELKAAFRSDEE